MLTASSTDLLAREENCRGSSRPFRWVNTSLSKEFMTTDVRATGLSSFNPVMEDFLGTWMIMERLKHDGTSHGSSDGLKICVKMGASWSAETFRQEGRWARRLGPEPSWCSVCERADSHPLHGSSVPEGGCSREVRRR